MQNVASCNNMYTNMGDSAGSIYNNKVSIYSNLCTSSVLLSILLLHSVSFNVTCVNRNDLIRFSRDELPIQIYGIIKWLLFVNTIPTKNTLAVKKVAAKT